MGHVTKDPYTHSPRETEGTCIVHVNIVYMYIIIHVLFKWHDFQSYVGRPALRTTQDEDTHQPYYTPHPSPLSYTTPISLSYTTPITPILHHTHQPYYTPRPSPYHTPHPSPYHAMNKLLRYYYYSFFF